jgi:hypothetical protein
MRFHTSDEFLAVVGAYQQAWLALLLDEHITGANIESIPVLLMTAILESAAVGNLTESELTEAALKRLEQLEFDLDVTPSLAN